MLDCLCSKKAFLLWFGAVVMAVAYDATFAESSDGVSVVGVGEFRFDVGSVCPNYYLGPRPNACTVTAGPTPSSCLPATLYCCSAASVPGSGSCPAIPDMAGPPDAFYEIHSVATPCPTYNVYACICDSWGYCIEDNGTPVPCGTYQKNPATC